MELCSVFATETVRLKRSKGLWFFVLNISKVKAIDEPRNTEEHHLMSTSTDREISIGDRTFVIEKPIWAIRKSRKPKKACEKGIYFTLSIQ